MAANRVRYAPQRGEWVVSFKEFRGDERFDVKVDGQTEPEDAVADAKELVEDGGIALGHRTGQFYVSDVTKFGVYVPA